MLRVIRSLAPTALFAAAAFLPACACGTNVTPDNEVCDDGDDNDGDGDADCDDEDCARDPACSIIGGEGEGEGDPGGEGEGEGDPPLPEANCTDGQDNDGDTFIDCNDFDCDDSPACQERCTDGVDNDGDRFVDCVDFDCEDDPACAPAGEGEGEGEGEGDPGGEGEGEGEGEGDPDIVDEAGNTVALATAFGNLPGPRTFSVNPAGDVDCWSFTLAQDSLVDFTVTNGTTTACADDFDTTLQVSLANGTAVPGGFVDDSNPAGGVDRCGDIVDLPLDAGAYVACVGEFLNDETLIGASLAITAIPQLNDEAGDTFATAAPLGALPATRTFNIDPGTDEDCFSFTLGIQSSVNINVDNSAGNCSLGAFDTVTVLVGSNDQEITRQDDSGADACGDILNRVLDPGSYAVCVTDFGNTTTPDILNGVEVSVTATPTDDFGDRTNPGRIALPGSQTMNIGFVGDVDCVSFDVHVVGTIQLRTDNGTATGCNGDTLLELFDSAGALITSDDDNGPGLCSGIPPRDIDNGAYTACVSEFNNDATITGVRLSTLFLPGILITEVADPIAPSSGGARFVEVHNVTTIATTVRNHELRRFSNGSATFSRIRFTDNVTIPAGGFYVIAANQADFEATFGVGQADQFNGGISGNGDDVYQFFAGDRLVDTFGVVGEQPAAGTSWNYLDIVVVRDITAIGGTVVAPSTTFRLAEWLFDDTPVIPDSFTPGTP